MVIIFTYLTFKTNKSNENDKLNIKIAHVMDLQMIRNTTTDSLTKVKVDSILGIHKKNVMKLKAKENNKILDSLINILF